MSASPMGGAQLGGMPVSGGSSGPMGFGQPATAAAKPSLGQTLMNKYQEFNKYQQQSQQQGDGKSQADRDAEIMKMLISMLG